MLEGFDPAGGIERRYFRGLCQIPVLSEREVSWVLDSGYQSKIACVYDGPIHESLRKRTLRWRSGISNRTGTGVDAIDFPAFVDLADKVYRAYESDFSLLGYDRTSWQK
jgi:hypothetical protein